MTSHRRDRHWPLSAGIPGDGVPRLSIETHIEGRTLVRTPTGVSGPGHGADDPRAMFAARFWGRRRFSDSVSQMTHGLTAQALHQLNVQNGDDGGDRLSPRSGIRIPDGPQLPPAPLSARRLQPPLCPTPPAPLPQPQHTTSCAPYDASYHPLSEAGPAGFFTCPGYKGYAVKPRNPMPLPSRREEFINALAEIEAKTGPVSMKGVGNLAKPILNKARSSQLLNYFLDSVGRSLLVPINSPICPPKQSPEPAQRDLRQLESELFDTAKYHNGKANHLTVLTWSEDNAYGTITLFEVDIDYGPPSHLPASGLASRRRHTPARLNLRRECALRVRPAAAMEDVPRQVLVGMRVDQGLKKAVLQYDKGTGRFRWMAQHAHRGGRPCYARVYEDYSEVCAIHTATAAGPGQVRLDYGGNESRGDARMAGRATNGERRRRRERSSLRVEDAREIISAAHHHQHGPVHIRNATPTAGGMTGAAGVVATIPQFLALTHATRAIAEKASSSCFSVFPGAGPNGTTTTGSVETSDGERLRAVPLRSGGGTMKTTRHRGRDVHVVVLVPDDAAWAEERIFWTDEANDGGSGMAAELRQKKYRDVIDGGERAGARTWRGGGTDRRRRDCDRDWEWDARSLSPLHSPRSPPLSPRTARW